MRFIVLLFIGMTTAIYSQVPYNIRLVNGLTQAHGKIVHELEDSYLCIGRGFESGVSIGQGIYATEIDKGSGKIINNARFEIPNRTLFFDNVNSGVKKNNNFYFIVGEGLNIYLCYYDKNTNKIINEKTLVPQFLTPIVSLYDFHYKGGIFHILASVEVGTTFKNSLLIIKYDMVNDIQTEILIDDENIDPVFAKMEFLPNENILIQYTRYENGAWLNLQEVDTLGNILWNYQFNKQYTGLVNRMIPLDSNLYLLGGLTGQYFGENFGQTPYMVLFDYKQRKMTKESALPLSIKDYNSRNDEIQEITKSHDGIHFLGVAELYKTNQDPDTIIGKGMVAKVDTNLNTIWRRSYGILDNNFVGHTLEDIIPTSDGNYLCYGKAFYYTILPGEIPLLSWVFKIDEDGKIVGDTTTTAAIDWEYLDLIDKVEIFPNPASNMIYINQNGIDHVHYQVFDMDGSLEDEFRIDHKNESVMKPIDEWNSGYKVIRMMKGGRLIGSIKILKI